MRFLFAVLFACLIAAPTQAQVVEEAPFMTLNCAKATVNYIDISPNGLYLLIGLNEYAELWDLSKEKRVRVIEHEPGGGSKMVYYAKFSPDGETIMTIDHKGKRLFWETASGKKVGQKGNLGNEWIPSPQILKTDYGLHVGNSASGKFYLQTEADHPKTTGVVAKSGKRSTVKFYDPDGEVLQTLTFEKVKDVLHQFPVFFYAEEGWFITGNDKGNVLFYKMK